MPEVTPLFTLCRRCNGEGWVCESHPTKAWNGGDPECCEGAGMPCVCNQTDPPWCYMSEVHACSNQTD